MIFNPAAVARGWVVATIAFSPMAPLIFLGDDTFDWLQLKK
jgi:hypothetical protein